MTKLQHTSHQPQELEDRKGFFKLTPQVSKKLINSNLSKSEMKLWLYLVAIAPFGNREYTYSSASLMLECGLKKATYFAAKAKLQKLGLIDFRYGETKFVNKLASAPLGSSTDATNFSEDKIVQKTGLQSKKLDSSPKNWTII